MGYLILEIREGSGWGDSESHYEFPSRYLARFEEAQSDGDAVALIYEPRRKGGRMAFVPGRASSKRRRALLTDATGWCASTVDCARSIASCRS